MSSSELLSRLGITVPIIQAPMAGVSTPALVAAVSNAGGLGSLGVAAMSMTEIDTTIRETRSLTNAPFNVNVFCHAPAVIEPTRDKEWLQYLAPYFEEFGVKPPDSLRLLYKSFVEDDQMLSVLLDLKPAVVSFHFGLPALKQIRRLKQAGILLLATATNLHEAQQIAAAELDGIVAQGYEAGGHRGTFDPYSADEALGIFPLTRILASNLSVPVISAGGIMDGAGIAAVLTLGASAAQLGTAFVPCPESSADPAYRNALLSGEMTRTIMTRAISGRYARGLMNRFTELGEAPSCPAVPSYPLAYFAGKALNAAAKEHGSSAFAPQWAGQTASMARWMPAADIVKTLVQELDTATQGNQQPLHAAHNTVVPSN